MKYYEIKNLSENEQIKILNQSVRLPHFFVDKDENGKFCFHQRFFTDRFDTLEQLFWGKHTEFDTTPILPDSIDLYDLNGIFKKMLDKGYSFRQINQILKIKKEGK